MTAKDFCAVDAQTNKFLQFKVNLICLARFLHCGFLASVCVDYGYFSNPGVTDPEIDVYRVQFFFHESVLTYRSCALLMFTLLAQKSLLALISALMLELVQSVT